MAHNNLAASLMTERRFTEAMAHFEKALDLNPGSAEAARIHINLGRALVLSGREQEAFRHFETAVEKSPSLAAAQHYLGKALFYLRGNKMEAFEHWRKALLAEPDSLALLNEMARAWRLVRRGSSATAERRSNSPNGRCVCRAGRTRQFSIRSPWRTPRQAAIPKPLRPPVTRWIWHRDRTAVRWRRPSAPESPCINRALLTGRRGARRFPPGKEV